MTTSALITLRRAETRDEHPILLWRNEEAARRASFQSSLIASEDHHRWFENKSKDDQCLLLMVDYDGLAIGNIRFDIAQDRTAEVSICFDPSYRGRGLSIPAMRLACATVFNDDRAESVIARIKDWNTASIRLFTSAGFVRQGEEIVGSETALIYRLDRPAELEAKDGR